MLTADLRRRVVVAAGALIATGVVAACSDSGGGFHPPASPGANSQRGSSQTAHSAGGGSGGGGDSAVTVLQTGVAPKLDSNGEGELVIWAKLRNTSTHDAPVLVGWTGYSASGAKLRSNEDSLGPQSTSGLVVRAGKTTFVATDSVFEGVKPARLVATPHSTDVPQSDTGLSVGALRIVNDPALGPIATVVAMHGKATSPDADDEWTAVNNLDMICTNAAGAVNAVGFLEPASDLTGVSFEGHPQETFKLELGGSLPSGAHCTASPDQWEGGY